MVSQKNKRIMITIPKNFDRLIYKAKEYALGTSMSNGFLFCYLILNYLFNEGYLNGEDYNRIFKEHFIDDK